MEKQAKIFVAGHKGLVGSAIVRKLLSEGYTNLILKERSELDLLNQMATEEFFERERPEYVFDAAAKVGGILANKTKKADFIVENLQIQNNVIVSAWKYGVRKLLFLGSVCIYPKACPQPVKEEYLLTGPLEETNDAYAVAKIAGITMCQSFNEQYGMNFISVMPCNLYGPHDNFDLESSHVLPAMLRKFYEARKAGVRRVTLWGTGKVYREFLHADDCADACVFLMRNYNDSKIINVGSGHDILLKDLAQTVSEIAGFDGEIVWDATKPDGMDRRLLDVSRIRAMGWKHSIELRDGLEDTFRWFLARKEK